MWNEDARRRGAVVGSVCKKPYESTRAYARGGGESGASPIAGGSSMHAGRHAAAGPADSQTNSSMRDAGAAANGTSHPAAPLQASAVMTGSRAAAPCGAQQLAESLAARQHWGNDSRCARSFSRASAAPISARGTATPFASAQARRCSRLWQQQLVQHCEAPRHPHAHPSQGNRSPAGASSPIRDSRSALGRKPMLAATRATRDIHATTARAAFAVPRASPELEAVLRRDGVMRTTIKMIWKRAARASSQRRLPNEEAARRLHAEPPVLKKPSRSEDLADGESRTTATRPTDVSPAKAEAAAAIRDATRPTVANRTPRCRPTRRLTPK